MKIFTVQFDFNNSKKYKTLLDVFRFSVRKFMPDTDFVECIIDPPEIQKNRPISYTSNTLKLQAWVDYLEQATEPVILTDCDMLMLRPAYHAFDIPFDVAFTGRTEKMKNKPMNGGVMFARPTEAAKLFFREMLRINNEILNRKISSRYVGINQPAFLMTYEKYKNDSGIKIYEYKTIEWNAVECDWKKINDKTVFLHVKHRLKESVLKNNSPDCKAMRLWYSMKTEMIRKKKVA